MQTDKEILDRVKDEYAKTKGEESWSELYWELRIGNVCVDSIAEAYYQAKVKQLAPSDEEVILKINSEYHSLTPFEIRLIKKWTIWMRDQFINPKK